jgi:hypothetical protein
MNISLTLVFNLSTPVCLFSSQNAAVLSTGLRVTPLLSVTVASHDHAGSLMNLTILDERKIK